MKSEPEIATESTCEVAESSEWKWNISDFRKELSHHSKERLDDSMKQSNDFTERSNLHSEKLKVCEESSKSGKDSLDSSKGSSSNNPEHSDDVEHSKGTIKNSTESSKERVNDSSENQRRSNEILQSLKSEFHLKNPPTILRNYNQGWKVAVRSLKEPSSSVHPPASKPPELNVNTSEVEKKGIILSPRNEIPVSDNMPVILNVFSLSKDSAKQLVSNIVQENSVLFTPPCSPPFIQLGSTVPVANQSTRFRNEIINNPPINEQVFPQVRENWYKPVHQTYHNFQEYLSKPVQQVNSHGKPVQQVYYNYPDYSSNPYNKQVSSQRYLNASAQQVSNSNFQEITLKPNQQVTSREYLDGRVKPVYHNYQENLCYPAQQVNSHEFLNKPVQQQVYYNPPPEYLSSKLVQPVYNNFEYRYTSVASSNPREYLPNPAQDYSQNNPQQIANGVLPLERQPSNQSEIEKYPSQRYTNYPGSNEHRSQLKHILKDSLREKVHSMAKGNGIYTRFKLKQTLTDINRTSYQSNEGSSTFLTTPAAQNASNIATTYSGVSQAVGNSGGVSSVSVAFLNAPSNVHTLSEVTTPPNNGNNVSPPKYTTEYGCSAVLAGYGRNTVVSQGSASPSHNSNTYAEHTFSSPTTISEKNSENSSIYGSPTTISEKHLENSSIYGEDQEMKSPGVFLTPRDAKVIELKQRLEEQEATIRKLRAAH